MSDQAAQPKPKEFSLSKEERELLQNQANLKSQHNYISSLIERDMFIYVNTTVRKRLGISNDMQMTPSIDQGKVFVMPKPVANATEPQKPQNGQAQKANSKQN